MVNELPTGTGPFGYVIHVKLYAGKDSTIQSDMGLAHGVVMDLMQNLKANMLKKGTICLPIISTPSMCWLRPSYKRKLY